jgi:tetratricopeptide (TPR) repeat protein
VGEQAERLAAVRARVERAAAGDLSAVLEPEALDEARQLAALLTPGAADLQAKHMLGLLYWYRSRSLRVGQDRQDLDTAVDTLIPCFLVGTDDLPTPLLPLLAERAAPMVTGWLKEMMGYADPEPLSTLVEMWQRIVRATPADHPARAGHLSGLGDALWVRSGRTGVPADLDAAIETFKQAMAATPADHADRAKYLGTLSGALWARFERFGPLADLEAAIEPAREAVAITAADHPDRAMHLGNLGALLRARFVRFGARADVDAAIEAIRQAVAATPADSPLRGLLLGNLSGALQSRFEHGVPRADLDAAIEAGREAVAATPTGSPVRGLSLSQLGGALRLRFWNTGVLADLDAAIEATTKAVAATAADHPGRAGYLSDLVGLLRLRFGRTGVPADLDAAIEAGREAVAATPSDSPDRSGRLNNLGIALKARFSRFGAQADVDAAVEAFREAVAAAPSEHPNQAGYLTNLVGALCLRFERTGEQADLDAALEAGPKSVAAAGPTPAEHPHWPTIMNNLVQPLHARFRRTGALDDLDAVIGVFRELVKTAPPHHPERAMYLSNLGTVLRTRFMRTAERADLDAALEAGREAVATAPADHADRAQYLFELGFALRLRFEQLGEPADLEAALSLCEQVVEADSAAPSVRIRAARAAAVDLGGPVRPGRMADLLEVAVRLLPEVAPRGMERGDQQHAIGELAGLASDAAALALANPDTPPGTERAVRALRLLEAGRAVLLSQALDTRSDLSDLRERRPDLAAQFVTLRDRLDRSAGPVALVPTPGSGAAELAEADLAAWDRRRAAEELATTLDQIRALPGFASFALPPTTDELLAEAESGPVVTFNISTHRSDALILTADGITALELPGLAHSAVMDQISAFHQARLTTADPAADERDRAAAQTRLRQTLQWLWDNAADQVLRALGHHRGPAPGAAWPRVWWAPGGLLGQLPLHAAGYHTDPAGPERRTVLDRVVSSYTSTVRALRYARQHAHTSPTADRALIVAMPTTPGVSGRLHHVWDEVDLLHARLPSPLLLIELDDAEIGQLTVAVDTPTKANVLAHLPGCAIAHFACHGVSDPADPSKSRLQLHDHRDDPLDVASLAPVDLDHAQLAYLSACGTAVTATTLLLDEAIHLTSAFQLAGFPHVIGSLWEVNDSIAVQIADAFYRTLGAGDGTLDTGQAAHALHHAVRAVRDRFPGTPSLWAAHVHAGA